MWAVRTRAGRATGRKKRRGKPQRRAKGRKSGSDKRRAEAAERRVTVAAERRAADRNPTRAATSFGDQLADLVDESRRNSVIRRRFVGMAADA